MGGGRHRLRRIGAVQLALLVAVEPAPRASRGNPRGDSPGLDQDCRIFVRQAAHCAEQRQQSQPKNEQPQGSPPKSKTRQAPGGWPPKKPVTLLSVQSLGESSRHPIYPFFRPRGPCQRFVLQSIEAQRLRIGQFLARPNSVTGKSGQLWRSDGEFRVFLGFDALTAGRTGLAQLLIMLGRASQGLPVRATEATGRVRSQGR